MPDDYEGLEDLGSGDQWSISTQEPPHTPVYRTDVKQGAQPFEDLGSGDEWKVAPATVKRPAMPKRPPRPASVQERFMAALPKEYRPLAKAGMTISAIDRMSMGPQLRAVDQAAAARQKRAEAERRISEEARATVMQRERERMAAAPWYERMGTRLATGAAKTGAQGLQLLENVAGAGLPSFAPGPVGQARQAAAEWARGQREQIERAIAEEEQIDPGDAGYWTRGGASLATGLPFVIGAGLAAGPVAGPTLLTGLSEDWERDPAGAALRTATAGVPVLAGKAISPIAARAAMRIPASVAAQKAAQVGIEAGAGGAANVAQYAATQALLGRPVDKREAVFQAVSGGVMSGVFTPGLARAAAEPSYIPTKSDISNWLVEKGIAEPLPGDRSMPPWLMEALGPSPFAGEARLEFPLTEHVKRTKVRQPWQAPEPPTPLDPATGLPLGPPRLRDQIRKAEGARRMREREGGEMFEPYRQSAFEKLGPNAEQILTDVREAITGARPGKVRAYKAAWRAINEAGLTNLELSALARRGEMGRSLYPEPPQRWREAGFPAPGSKGALLSKATGTRLSMNPFADPESWMKLGSDVANFFRTRVRGNEDKLKALSRAPSLGVKQGNIDFSGVRAFIEQNPSATPEQIAQFAESQTPDVTPYSPRFQREQSFFDKSANPTARRTSFVWRGAPQGVDFKWGIHHGGLKNVLFDVAMEDRQATTGETGAMVSEAQSDFYQGKGDERRGVPEGTQAPFKSDWLNRAFQFAVADARKRGLDGVFIPKTREQVIRIQNWKDFPAEGTVDALGKDMAPIFNRYLKDFPKELTKVGQQGQRALEVRTIDTPDGPQEVWFLPVGEETRSGRAVERPAGREDFLSFIQGMRSVPEGETARYGEKAYSNPLADPEAYKRFLVEPVRKWYYSQLEKAVGSKFPETMTPEQAETLILGARTPTYGPGEDVTYTDPRTGKQKTRRMKGEVTGYTRTSQYEVKPEEYEWSGIPELLAAKSAKGEQVTRQELLDTIRANQVEVEETVLGQPPDQATADKIADLNMAIDDLRREVDELYKEADQSDIDWIPQTPDPRYPEYSVVNRARMTNVRGVELRQRAEDKKIEQARLEGELEKLESLTPEAAKFDRWRAIKSGDPSTYREILLTMPDRTGRLTLQPGMRIVSSGDYQVKGGVAPIRIGKPGMEYGLLDAEGNLLAVGRTPENAMRYHLTGQHEARKFESSHFRQKNILAHVRFQEGRDKDGRRVLILQEIQSDWHQQGREKGYVTPRDITELEKKYLDTVAEAREAYNESDWKRDMEKSDLSFSIRDWYGETELGAIYQQAVGEAQEAYYDAKQSNIPDAPFKQSWHELAMKRMIRWAADNGYDRIVWPSGAQQIDLYQNALRQNVDSIKWETTKSGNINLYPEKDGRVDPQAAQQLASLDDARLKEVLGPRMAKIILDQRDQSWDEKGYASGRLKGEGLSIGGQIHKLLYDEKLPQFARDLTRKFGGETGKTELPSLKSDFTDADAIRNTAIVHNEEMGRYEARENDGTAYETQFEGFAMADTREEVQEMLERDAQYFEQQAKAEKGQTVHYIGVPPRMAATAQQEGFRLFSNPFFDPSAYRRFLGGLFNRRNRTTPPDANDPNAEVDAGKSQEQVDVQNTIDDAMQRALSGGQAYLSQSAAEYERARGARNQARNRLKRLKEMKEDPNYGYYVDPAKKFDLDRAIGAAEKDAEAAMSARQAARKQFKIAEGVQQGQQRKIAAVGAQARLATPETSYPVDPNRPMYVEQFLGFNLTKPFYDAALDVAIAAGKTLDPDRTVTSQVVEWAANGEIPLVQFDQILEKNGLTMTDFLNQITATASEAGRMLAKPSHIARQLNKLAKTNPELAKAIQERLPNITNLNRMNRERSNLDRFISIRSGLLISLIETAQRNLQSATLVTGLDSIGQVFDSAIQNTFGAKAFDNKATLSPSIAMRPFLNIFTEIANSLFRGGYQENAGAVSRAVSAIADQFRKEVKVPLFEVLYSDLEDPVTGAQLNATPAMLQKWREDAAKLPESSKRREKLIAAIDQAEKRYNMNQRLLTRGLIRGERIVHALNYFNRAQETITRRAIFEGKLRRYAQESGIDLDQLLADGRAADLPRDMVKRAADEALRVTFGKRPEPNTATDYLRRALATGPIGAAVKLGLHAFPTFLGNFLKFQYEYSPAGLLSLMSAKERARMEKGDFSMFWKASIGTAMFGMASMMRENFYESQGSPLGEEEKSLEGPLEPPLRAGEKWYEVRVGSRNIDMRFTPFGPAFFAADLVARQRRGLTSGIQPRDVLDALGANLRGLEQQAGILQDAIQGIADAEKAVDAGKLSGRYLGAIAAGFLTPLRYVSDLMSTVSTEERKRRDLGQGESFAGALGAQLQERIPYFRQRLPEAEVPTKETAPMPRGREGWEPIFRQATGFTGTEPKNYIERELDTLGIKPFEIVPRIGNPKADRVVNREMGKFMDGLSAALEADPGFTSLSPEERRMAWIDEIFPAYHQAVRDLALAEVPEELIKAEIAKAFTKEQKNVEDRKRKRAGQPTLQQEIQRGMGAGK